GVDGATHTLTWGRSPEIGGGSMTRAIAGVGFTARATWSEGAWHLAARPGRIDYKLTRNGDGACVEHGGLSIQPGADRLALADRSALRALVTVRVHRARVVDRIPLVTAVLGSLRGPDGSIPALVGADFHEIRGEYGQLDVRLGLPTDTRWKFIEEGSVLAFDEREL